MALAAGDSPGSRGHQGQVTGTGARSSAQKEKTEAVNGTKAMTEADVLRKCPKPWLSDKPLCLQVPLLFPILVCFYVNPVPPVLGSKAQL